MGEDEHGWSVKGLFDLESPKGPHVYRLVKGRRLNQLSFAYDTIDQAGVELENGLRQRVARAESLRILIRAHRREPRHLRGGSQVDHRPGVTRGQSWPRAVGQKRERTT
ncbi:HK97 family phage prohead protease [Mycobacteroides chelonae]|uniref:HK97 family phage prohead protease n=1 Tax=Mycobacteroides chelonae TaxID=1774 RepID=UPI003AAF1BA3